VKKRRPASLLLPLVRKKGKEIQTKLHKAKKGGKEKRNREDGCSKPLGKKDHVCPNKTPLVGERLKEKRDCRVHSERWMNFNRKERKVD